METRLRQGYLHATEIYPASDHCPLRFYFRDDREQRHLIFVGSDAISEHLLTNQSLLVDLEPLGGAFVRVHLPEPYTAKPIVLRNQVTFLDA